ncbi:MAG: DUF429 domain-containing protein, partial [Aestuariivirgaceae bacterium]|nr:DUF429 domain-containing protein [Aestuariivirgaceae bacterium]
PSRFLGVDGCRNGWLAVSWDGGSSASAVIYPAFADILKLDHQFIAIDVPIGLPDWIEKGGRTCERLARAILKTRASSIFSSPARAVLAAQTYAEARALNAQASAGIKMSAQGFGILAKIREVDETITPADQTRISETHPELIFVLMNGQTPLAHGKKTPEGKAERRALLAKAGFPLGNLDIPPKSSGWGEDDLLDACACAWSAKRLATGAGLRLPEMPEYDARGLRMEICG